MFPTVYIKLFLIRFINAAFIVTYQDPDEYWQSLEVAHNLVYGTGYLTWDWTKKIRGIFFPGLFASLYWLYKHSDLEEACPWMYFYIPAFVQALIASLFDYSVYKIANEYFPKQKKLALFLSLLSYFNFTNLVRTTSNAFEAATTGMAFACFPWKQFKDSSYKQAVFWISVAFIVRPTVAIIWLYPLSFYLYSILLKNDFCLYFKKGFLQALPIFIFVNFISIGLDSLYYGQFTLTALNFLKFNVFEGLSGFYGVNSAIFYLSAALPAMLTAYLPFFCFGSLNYENRLVKHFLITILATITIYSLLSHKEVRFIYGLFPLMLVIASESVSKQLTSKKKKLLIFLLFTLSNLVPAFYLSRIHFSGTLKVVDYLRENQHIQDSDTIYFLMPCHSTPFYSNYHQGKGSLAFVTCQPPIGIPKDQIVSYKDESDLMYENPAEFLSKKLIDNIKYIVCFEHLIPAISIVLQQNHFREVYHTFNSHWSPDERRSGDIVVFSIKN